MRLEYTWQLIPSLCGFSLSNTFLTNKMWKYHTLYKCIWKDRERERKKERKSFREYREKEKRNKRTKKKIKERKKKKGLNVKTFRWKTFCRHGWRALRYRLNYHRNFVHCEYKSIRRINGRETTLAKGEERGTRECGDEKGRGWWWIARVPRVAGLLFSWCDRYTSY